jgi:hypothetical protein
VIEIESFGYFDNESAAVPVLIRQDIIQVNHSIRGYFFSIMYPALRHAFHPPLMAYMFLYPLFIKSCATRALVRSFFQSQ